MYEKPIVGRYLAMITFRIVSAAVSLNKEEMSAKLLGTLNKEDTTKEGRKMGKDIRASEREELRVEERQRSQ